MAHLRGAKLLSLLCHVTCIKQTFGNLFLVYPICGVNVSRTMRKVYCMSCDKGSCTHFVYRWVQSQMGDSTMCCPEWLMVHTLPIVSPEEYPANYYNRKGWHSILMQGTMNQLGQFIDVYIGRPGRVHDANLFSKD